MDFKSFMNTVEENLSLIKTEDELRNWIRDYARSIPEEERGSFLEQMQTRKPRSHKEILKELTDCWKRQSGQQISIPDSIYGYWISFSGIESGTDCRMKVWKLWGA